MRVVIDGPASGSPAERRLAILIAGIHSQVAGDMIRDLDCPMGQKKALLQTALGQNRLI